MTSSFQLLKQAFRLIGENPVLFLKIISLPALISILVNIFQPNQDSAIISLAEWSVFIPLVVTLAVVNIFMSMALVFAVADRSLSMRASFQLALSKFWKYLAFSICLGLITFFAFILLIIPGIIVSVWFAFAAYFLLLENLSISQSFKASKSLVKGRWWTVARRLFSFFFFAMVISILIALLITLLSTILPESITYTISTVLNLMFAPVAVAYMFLLYFALKNTSSENIVSTAPAYQ